MSEQSNIEREPTPKSFIRINNEEHNFKRLLDLLKENGIKVNMVSAQDSRPNAEKRVTEDFIPSLSTQIEIGAPYDEVRRVLDSSDEFSEFADSILGSA